MRRTLVMGLTALGCLALVALAGRPDGFASAATPTSPKRKPNVIVIIADDLGYADISAYGIKRISTPNIDRIGNEGVKFTNGYATAPVCSPSRAGLQTGRYQQRFGFEFNNGPANRDAEQGLGLDTNEITIAQALKDNGYRTALIGKWHLGSQEQFYPTKRGYEEFVGLLTGATSYIDAGAPGVITFRKPGGIKGGSADGRDQHTQIVEGPDRTVVHNEQEYLTEYFARRAVEFVSRRAESGDPYFLYLAFTAPHDPLTTTKKYYDRFPQIKDEQARVYASMVSALDDAVGAVMRAVDASGEGDNTIVYFLSDNGCAAYYSGMCACEPLRGGKLTHYEGGVRVPMLMRWPAGLKGGQIYRHVVSTLDVFPTLIAAAGGNLPGDRPYDGVNLTPYLNGEKSGLPHDALVWRRRPMASIRKGDWKLWKSLDGKFTLLFNLKDDLNEGKNLASSRPDKVKELEAAFERWARDMQDPKWPSRPAVTYEVCGTPFTVPI